MPTCSSIYKPGIVLCKPCRVYNSAMLRNYSAKTCWRIFNILILGLNIHSYAFAGQGGYDFLADWDDLSTAKRGITAGLASSYDRTGQEEDFNYYQQPVGFRVENEPVVLAEITGPGMLTRFWMPHVTAMQGFPMRVIVDGKLQIDTTSEKWLSGQYGYFSAPLVQTRLGGQVSYEPVAFARSLRIESENRSVAGPRTHHYYQCNYLTLPAASSVAPYTGRLNAQQRHMRGRVMAMLAHVGTNPAGPCPSAKTRLQGKKVVGAGETATLWTLPDSGTVRALHVKFASDATDSQLDGLWLEVTGGGDMGGTIDVPVSHFFGIGQGRARYRSLPLGTDVEGICYCYWPMPFRKSLRVQVYNAGRTPVAIESARIEYDPAAPPADAAYLHAVYREERTTQGQQYYTLLDTPGNGHYVGNLLYVVRPQGGRSLLEGDDLIIVSPGASSQRLLHGTGLEDAYNGGFYYNHSAVAGVDNPADPPNPSSGAGPFSGLLRFEMPDTSQSGQTRVDQYRWMIGDFVPFTGGIVVKVENFARQPDVLFGSTTFYYADPCSAP